MGLFGGKGGGNQKTETKLPDYVTHGGQQAVNLATQISQQPYVPYSGARVAGLSPNEAYATSQAPGELNRYGGTYGTAANMTMTGAQPNTQYWLQNYQQYMNPYMKSAIDPAAREVANQAEVTRLQNNMKSAQQGAFGGSRTALLESENERNKLQTIGDLYSRGLADAYGQGMQGFQMDTGIRDANAQRAMYGGAQLGSLAGQEAGIRQNAYQNMLQTGVLDRSVQQAALDAAYQDYLTQRDWSMRGLGALTSAVSGVPTGQTQTARQPDPNYLTELAGTGLMMSQLGAFCWVAREVYGTEDDRWLRFRKWLITKAPRWLVRLYARHGEAFARWLAWHPRIKRMVKSFMDRVI